MSAPEPGWRDPVDFYRTHAARFDDERTRSLIERGWLEAFAALIPPGGTILDLGCGMGEPIAAWLIGRGFRLTGVDATAALLDRARGRLPQAEWIEVDMRGLALGRRFDGIVAWDSVFHLTVAAQRACFATFAAHAAPGAPLMVRAPIRSMASRSIMRASPPTNIAACSPGTASRCCAMSSRTPLAAGAPSG